MAPVTDVLRYTKLGPVSLKRNLAQSGNFLLEYLWAFAQYCFCGSFFNRFLFKNSFLGKEQYRVFSVFRV